MGPRSRSTNRPRTVRCSHEGMGMEILSHGARIDADPLQRHQVEAELARLRAQVTWLQAERAALWWAVGHDELTGLANRRLFQTLAPPLLRECGRRAAVLVIDLNGFKPINDRFGHGAWGGNAVDAAPAPATDPVVVELAVFPVARQPRTAGSAPVADPDRRDPAEVAPASAYRCGDPVWVYRYGAWRPGVVEGASVRAVMATYRCTAGRGTVVDTMSAEYVMPRGDVDAQLDAAFSAPDVELSR